MDSRAIDCQRHDQFADLTEATKISVVSYEFALEVFAQVTLLSVGSFAILLNVQ
jgi:hypothetical protein